MMIVLAITRMSCASDINVAWIQEAPWRGVIIFYYKRLVGAIYIASSFRFSSVLYMAFNDTGLILISVEKRLIVFSSVKWKTLMVPCKSKVFVALKNL